MKTVYLGTEPEIDIRLLKIARSLKKWGYQFEVLRPKIKTRFGGRAISAFLRYIAYLFQIFISNADLYWVANCPDVVVMPLIVLKRRYVYDFRSVWSNEIKAEFGRGVWPCLARIIERSARKNAKIIVLNTDTLLKDARPYLKPLFLVPNYPSKNFKSTIPRSRFRKMYGVTKDSKVVLYIGRLSRVEGVDQFPQILEKLSKHEIIKLWIVGSGPLKYLVESLQKNYPTNMRYFGWQPYEQIPNFINASDVCIVPRHFDHNTPYYNEKGVLKISEYMMFRKPIACSGIAPSNQYLLVKEDEIVEGILQALEGGAPVPTPRTWEEDAEADLLVALKTTLCDRR